MRRLASYFLRGLAFGAPLAVTIYVCYRIFTAIDGWMGLPIPGLGFVVTIALFTLIGFLGSTLLATSALSTIDRAVERLSPSCGYCIRRPKTSSMRSSASTGASMLQ